MRSDYLTLLNLEQPPKMSADFESNAPTGLSLTDIEGMEQLLIGVRTHTGQTVTPARAMRCATVLACMRIISEDIGALPLKLYKRGTHGPEEAVDHPVHRMLDVAPNDVMTSIELREHIIFDLMLYGNFYVLKNGETELESLWPLQAGYVTRRWRELVWTFTDPITGVSGSFTPDLVWRGTLLSGNGIDGQAISLLCREAIGLLLAAEEQGARLFRNGIQTDMTLSAEGEIADKDQLRQQFMARHSGSANAFMPMLLENGLKANRIGLTAQESQYMDARAYQTADIARAFRIPEVLLGTTGKSKASTYASAEQFFISYTKHTLTPWAVRIEQTINRDLLTAKEQKKYFARHDFASLLRGDTAARYASYVNGIEAGFLSPAYARQAEGLPYVPGLDYYNKPPQTAGADGDGGSDSTGAPLPAPLPKEAPTDESGKNELPRRVANLILRKERKGLTSGQQADTFYTLFAGFVEDITGAGLDSVLAYCEMRRTTADRFSTESQSTAIDALISLCKKDA